MPTQCEFIIFVDRDGKKTFCPRDAFQNYETVGQMCDLHWPLAIIAGFKPEQKEPKIETSCDGNQSH